METLLEATPLGRSLLADLGRIRGRAEQLLVKINETFPEYTDHSINHSLRITEIFRNIIPDALKESFNEYEIFFLEAATYLHDIGMVNFPDLVIPQEIAGDKEKIAAYLRENHHIRSEQIICQNFRELLIEDEYQADIIGRIALGHRKVDLSDPALFESDRVYKNASINMPLLAAILRLGDSLDISFERAPAIIFEKSFIKDPVSVQEWQKHLSISGVVPQPEDPLTLKANAKCSSPKVHRLLKKLESEINNELENLPRYLFQYRNHRKEFARRFIITIESKGYKAYDFKFSLQEAEITRLLMGDRLYSRKEESLRELLKNAVDACRVKQALLQKKNMSYYPSITFEQTSDERLIIEDNGIGMDEDTIERYFTKIGKSFYQSKEFSDNFDFTPVSELGIGFLSSFMIAERITVETKKDHSSPILMEIDDVSDFFIVHEGKREESGTTVTLTLKKGLSLSLENEVKNYARHIETPIKIKIYGQPNIIEIKDTGFSLSMEMLAKTQNFSPIFLQSHKFYSMKIDSPEIEGIIGILVRSSSTGAIEPFSSRRLPWNTDKALNSVSKALLSNEGIFIGNIFLVPSWIDRNGAVFYDLNIKKKALDLNAARNNVINNSKLETISNFVEVKVYELFQRFLSELREKNDEATSEFCTTFFNNYLSFFSILNAKKESERQNRPFSLKEQLISLIKQYTYITCYTKTGIENIKTADLLERKDKLVTIFSINAYTESDRRNIISGCSWFDQQHLYVNWEQSYNASVLKLIFNVKYGYDLLSAVNIEQSDELTNFIPSTWVLARINNYTTRRMMAFCHGQTVTVLNRDNPFIDLLIQNKAHFKGPKRMAVFGFFRTLKYDRRHNFPLLQEKQKDILRLLVEDEVITESQIERFIITKDDFPPHMFN